MRLKTRGRSRLAIAFIGLWITVTSTLANGYWEDASERLTDVQTWDELCNIEGCDEFPEGYATYQIGPDLYYLPQYETLIEKPLAVYSVRPGRFEDINDDGKLIRSFGYSDGLRLNWCCHFLMTFFGLADTFPYKVAGSQSGMVPSRTVTISPYDVNTLRYHGITLMEGVLFTEGFWPRLDEVFPDGLPSYNNEFWLVDVERQDANRKPIFRILSKKPLLSGRHVYAYCQTSCRFSTMAFRKDQESELPHIDIRWVVFPGVELFNCEPEYVEFDCTPAPDEFADVPLMLEHYDHLFEKLRALPKEYTNE